MNYQNQGQAARLAQSASGVIGGSPVPLDKPRLHSQLDQLEKLLNMAHSIASNIESAADRLVGPLPPQPGTAAEKAPINTIEHKLSEVIGSMEGLVHRLETANGRIMAAV